MGYSYGEEWHVVGLQELEAQFKLLEDTIAEALVIAAEAAALPIERRWKENVLNHAHLTGTYLRSIHSAVMSVARDNVVLIIGTDIDAPPYPAYLEFGTSKMAPRPTLGPAFDDGRQEALSEFSSVLRSEILKITRT